MKFIDLGLGVGGGRAGWIRIGVLLGRNVLRRETSRFLASGSGVMAWGHGWSAEECCEGDITSKLREISAFELAI